MTERDADMLDRHALVTAIWLPFGLVAAALFKIGVAAGGWPFVGGGFAVIIVAFAAHVIVNAAYGTFFTPKEVGLGLVLYATALFAFGIAVLLSPSFRAASFLSLSLGFIAVAIVVVFYMITHVGVRRAFESFDVIRRFRA
jgi:hypothetical protein